MQQPPPIHVIVLIIVGVLAYAVMIHFVDRSLTGPRSVLFRYLAFATTAALFLFGVGKLYTDSDRAAGVVKIGIAMTAAGGLLYEQHRAGMRRPVSERWKRFVGITLGIVSIVAYFHAFKPGYYKYYHRHDVYHYYLGAKYFPEIGYDDLYKCTVIAQDQLGTIEIDEGSRHTKLDLTKEVRRPDRKIRNLGADNLLMPAATFLEHPEECTSHFSPERWTAFKDDIRFFRTVSDRDFFEKMQSDHGYNPPPVWMLAGRFFADMYPAGQQILGFVWLQWLAMLDNVLLAGMFAALWWAFGWRVFAIGAVFWGCNAPGDDYFVQGAFLRQDWLFFFVLAACLARKRWFALSAASLVYAGLLRIFPGLPVIAWLVVAGAYLFRKKRMAPHHKRMLLGGVLAAAVLIPASIKVCGADSYKHFYEHTLQVHDRTPLTNHMGLRPIIAQGFKERAMYTKSDRLADPFEVWKRLRNERYDKYKPIAWAIMALSLAFFAWVVGQQSAGKGSNRGPRVSSMWIALCLGQIFIILLSQLTSYYYAFLVITAPLTRVKRQIEVPYLGLAALTQIIWMAFGWFDDKSVLCTVLILAFCYWLVSLFAPKDTLSRIQAMLGRRQPPQPAEPGA
jgi:hypothetical protein